MKKPVVNIQMTFLPYVPAHLEYFKDKYNLVKLKNGEWDLVTWYGDHDKYGMGKVDNLLQSIDPETVWHTDDIEYWALLPKEIK